MAEGVKEAGTDGIVGAAAADVEPDPDPVNAPYGYTRDKKTPGGWRPKKRPGRGGRPKPASDSYEHAGSDDERDHPFADGPDPDPGWAAGSARKEPYKATADERNDVAALLALAYSVPADFLLQVDPYCFGELNANLEGIIDATVPIICRSERVVKYVTGSSGLILYIKLAAAFRPFLVAAWKHHVLHSVVLERGEDGETYAVPNDYSAYSAA
jgi:hypothetical protein